MANSPSSSSPAMSIFVWSDKRFVILTSKSETLVMDSKWAYYTYLFDYTNGTAWTKRQIYDT